MWTKRFLIVFLLFLTMFSALAGPRPFPHNAKRGTMSVGNYPQVFINAETRQLSPGAKIFSRENTIVMYSTLVNNVYVVNYTVDSQGFIDKIWILRDEELDQPLQQ